jgi:hypothetical protein
MYVDNHQLVSLDFLLMIEQINVSKFVQLFKIHMEKQPVEGASKIVHMALFPMIPPENAKSTAIPLRDSSKILPQTDV